MSHRFLRSYSKRHLHSQQKKVEAAAGGGPTDGGIVGGGMTSGNATGGNATTGAGAGDTGGLRGEGSGGGGSRWRRELKDKNSLLHHSSFFDNLYSTPANTQIILTGYVSTILSDYL